MKVTAKMLTNECLVSIVDSLIKAHGIPDDIILKYYRHGLIDQVKSIKRQLENIEKKAKAKRLSHKDAMALYRKEQGLVTLGNKKLAILKELENATN